MEKKKAKRKMGRVMQLASFSLAEVTYATGDIAFLVQEQAKSASFKVKAKQENVSGVVLPAFDVDRVPGTGAQRFSYLFFPIYLHDDIPSELRL
jgi:vacuolar-type H+-ATPase subunit D/Vma8